MNSYPSSFPGNPGAPGGPSGMPGGMPGAVPSGMGPGAPTDPPGKGKKDKGPKEPKGASKRSVVNYKVGVALAIVVGLIALYITTIPDETKFVVRASGPVTALSPVDASQMEAIALPPEAIEEDTFVGDTAEEAIKEATDNIKGVTRVQLYKGQQLRSEQFVNNDTVAEDLDLAPNERLVSISATVSTAVAGTIRAGDRVDVIAVSGDNAETIGGVVAYDVPVMSVTAGVEAYEAAGTAQTGEDIDKKPSELLPGAPVPGIYVIKVPVEQSARMAVVDQGAELYLSYRAPGSETSPATVEVLAEIICTGDPLVEQADSFVCQDLASLLDSAAAEE